jgi:hypothetical protein
VWYLNVEQLDYPSYVVNNSDNRTGGKRNAAQESEWIHTVFTGGGPSLREDGVKTMLNPNTRESLHGAAQSFRNYVKVTERMRLQV